MHLTTQQIETLAERTAAIILPKLLEEIKPERNWLTKKQIKTLYDWGERKVMSLYQRGEIYGKKDGKSWRFDKSSIEDFLEEGR